MSTWKVGIYTGNTTRVVYTLVIISAVYMAVSSSSGIGVLINYMDVTSLLILFILCIPILISSGLIKDFNNGFRILFKKGKQTNLAEIKRAVEAVELTMKILLYSGMFSFLFSVVIILDISKDIASFGGNLSVSLVSLTYALAINMVLHPIRTKLKVKLIDYIQE